LVEQCDAIYIPTDNILGFSHAYSLWSNSGNKNSLLYVGRQVWSVMAALATLGINYYDLGYQTGEMAVPHP
jgi:putative ABC transport system substrate-binding protein